MAALLHVRLHEVLGVRLEHFVDLVEEIVELRLELLTALRHRRGDVVDHFFGALGRLLAVVERYPELKSAQNFAMLQSQIEGTENRIAIARRDYIQAVRQYNTEITTFPGRLWKTVLYPSAQEMATFDIPAEEQKVPKVDFGTSK